MRAMLLAACLTATSAAADVVVAVRTIPANTLIAPEDLSLRPLDVPGAVTNPDEIVGLETRIALYAGRPVRPQDVGPPAIVDRNQIVPLVYEKGGLRIATEGRALDRGGPGDVIRIMNLSSRTTVTAVLEADGSARVSN